MAAVDDDELEYLQPGFDPASLTVARLRGILVEYDIPYASSAKKTDLIAIFKEQLVPRARKILSARARTTRTSKGITDMPSSQEGTINGDVEEPSSRAATVSETGHRKSTRTSRQSTAETGEGASAFKKTPARKKTSTQARSLDTDAIAEMQEIQTATRKGRSSERPVKVEDPDTPPRRLRQSESVFSDENPFQSGSSPLLADDSRRSIGAQSVKRKSTSRRRKTEDSTTIKREDRVSTSSSPNADIFVHRASRSSIKVEPGEEFTAEEQQELNEEEAHSGTVSRHRANTAGTPAARSAFWTIIMVVLIGYGFLWRKEKLELGYCGVGKRTTALEEYNAPEWLSFLQPSCEPCPSHASCYSGMLVKCDSDFVLSPHPLALGGAIPVPPTCEPDGEKVRKIHAVAEKAVEELRERRAKFECGELTEEGKPATVVEIAEPQLKASVSQKRRRGMSEHEFEELWKGALGEILGREEVSSVQSGLANTLQLSSSSLTRLPFGCALRRSARLALARYRVEAAGIIALLALILFARNYVRTLRRDTARVPALVSTTLDRLATQAALHGQGSRAEPWASVGRLRDDVLRDEFSAKRREDIWRRVQSVVELNANVRSSVREDHNGEVSRVWEWVGSLPTHEDERAERRGGRTSMLLDAADTSGLHAESGNRRALEARKWDEGRPIY